MSPAKDSEFPALNLLATAFRAYEELAAASRMLKSRYDRARNAALILGALAAGAGVAASLITGTWAARPLGIASAILLALGGFIGKEFLTPSGETEWAKLRLRAESLKRSVWKAAMRVSPFDGEDAPAVLEREIAQFSKPSPTVLGTPKRGEPPKPGDVEDYLGHRVQDQLTYYRNKAGEYTKSHTRLRWGLIVVGMIAAATGVLGSVLPQAAALVSLLTTVCAALVALIQSSRIEALIPLYRDTASDLELLIAKWNDEGIRRVGQAADERHNAQVLLVMACEEAMSRENGSWRTAWLDPAQLQASREQLDKARAQAESTAAGKLPGSHG